MSGRKISEDVIYAREIGIKTDNVWRTLRLLGGADKLRSLSPEVRNILVSSVVKRNKVERNN